MSLERQLIVPDTHRPYHDKRAWRLMLKVAGAFEPHTLIHLGDYGDFYSVSSHIRHTNRDRKLKWEVDSCNEGLNELDAIKPKPKRKIFIAGNHEHRLERYLHTKAPELFDFVDVPSLFKLAERGWEYVPYQEHIQIGKIFYTHDVGSAGRMAPFKALDVYKHGVVTGHTHKMAYIVEGNRAGDMQLSAILGWLGDVTKIDYRHRARAARDCALGFGIGYYDTESHLTYLQPVPIVKYTCCVEGKVYKG